MCWNKFSYINKWNIGNGNKLNINKRPFPHTYSIKSQFMQDYFVTVYVLSETWLVSIEDKFIDNFRVSAKYTLPDTYLCDGSLHSVSVPGISWYRGSWRFSSVSTRFGFECCHGLGGSGWEGKLLPKLHVGPTLGYKITQMLVTLHTKSSKIYKDYLPSFLWSH